MLSFERLTVRKPADLVLDSAPVLSKKSPPGDSHAASRQ